MIGSRGVFGVGMVSGISGVCFVGDSIFDHV
jgi:hypothetical protein